MAAFGQCYNRRVPVFESRVLNLVTHNPAQTRQFGARIGRAIRAGDVICLSGELGAGKTTLASGIGEGWGAREVVNSPTFVFVNEYSRAAGGKLYHVDAYRLRDAADAESIALPDMLNEVSEGRSALLIEWPERVAEQLPPERLWIDLVWVEESARRIQVTANGARYNVLVESIR